MNTIENDKNLMTINEGRVSITVPHFEKVSAKALVFYNPVMELNRDISIIALQTFRETQDEDINICDAFGGTGIRGIRYSRELSGVQNVVINDLNLWPFNLRKKISLRMVQVMLMFLKKMLTFY